MQEREQEFPKETHAAVMRAVRVIIPLRAWAVRGYCILTAGLSAFSLFHVVANMHERRAFEFIQVALDSLLLDFSVWPYFSSVAFEFIPSGWTLAFIANGALLILGILVIRKWKRAFFV